MRARDADGAEHEQVYILWSMVQDEAVKTNWREMRPKALASAEFRKWRAQECLWIAGFAPGTVGYLIQFLWLHAQTYCCSHFHLSLLSLTKPFPTQGEKLVLSAAGLCPGSPDRSRVYSS